jgi:hypothetical protein
MKMWVEWIIGWMYKDVVSDLQALEKAILTLWEQVEDIGDAADKTNGADRSYFWDGERYVSLLQTNGGDADV